MNNNTVEAQKSSGRRTKLSKKIRKKFVIVVLKDTKTSLERIRVTQNAFSCYDTISRGKIRRLLKNMVVSHEILQKVSLEEKQVFSF